MRARYIKVVSGNKSNISQGQASPRKNPKAPSNFITEQYKANKDQCTDRFKDFFSKRRNSGPDRARQDRAQYSPGLQQVRGRLQSMSSNSKYLNISSTNMVVQKNQDKFQIQNPKKSYQFSGLSDIKEKSLESSHNFAASFIKKLNQSSNYPINPAFQQNFRSQKHLEQLRIGKIIRNTNQTIENETKVEGIDRIQNEGVGLNKKLRKEQHSTQIQDRNKHRNNSAPTNNHHLQRKVINFNFRCQIKWGESVSKIKHSLVQTFQKYKQFINQQAQFQIVSFQLQQKNINYNPQQNPTLKSRSYQQLVQQLQSSEKKAFFLREQVCYLSAKLKKTTDQLTSLQKSSQTKFDFLNVQLKQKVDFLTNKLNEFFQRFNIMSQSTKNRADGMQQLNALKAHLQNLLEMNKSNSYSFSSASQSSSQSYVVPYERGELEFKLGSLSAEYQKLQQTLKDRVKENHQLNSTRQLLEEEIQRLKLVVHSRNIQLNNLRSRVEPQSRPSRLQVY